MQRNVWSEVCAGLSADPQQQLNTAVEACDRWAASRSRLAMVLRHQDGVVERWTYHELARESARFGEALGRLGLRRGSRVAALLGRQRETWLAALGTWRAGLVYVPLFTGFGSDAIADRISEASVDAVVVDYRSREVLQTALERVDRDLPVITVAGPRGEGIMHGDRSFWAELARSSGGAGAVATAPDDPATLMFTSGTTSTPKACVIPHSGFVSLIPFVEACFGLQADDMLFSTSDPGWSYGLYTTGIVPMALGFPRLVYTGDFDPAAWLRAISAEDVTFIAGAPSAFRRLAQQVVRTGIAPSVRGASCAGEPLDANTVRMWTDAGAGPLLDGYGLTEVGMVLTNMRAAADAVRPGSLAAAVPGFDVGLMDENGAIIDGEGLGQIVVGRPEYQLSSGYANTPGTWAARWKGGWFLTGDLARRDADGHWWYQGRADDVIVTSGYNVGPVEVESVLLEHPDVADAAVVAEPDLQRGSIVRAVIVRSNGARQEEVLTAELKEAVRVRIGRHAYPRIVEYADALPRTATGKLQRGQLRT